MAKTKIGDRVYLPHLEQFGIVRKVMVGGTISQVEVKDTFGKPKIINTVGIIVEVAVLVKRFLPMLRDIFVEVRSWFKKKDDGYPPPLSPAETEGLTL